MDIKKFNELIGLNKEIEDLEDVIKELENNPDNVVIKIFEYHDSYAIFLPESVIPGLIEGLKEHLAKLKKEFEEA